MKTDVLVIIAHPDDEVFVSGTLCLLSEKAPAIALVCITDGENGSRELLQHLPPERNLGEIRRRELALSAWALGVGNVVFLAQADIVPDNWGKSTSWDVAGLIASLERIIRDAGPSLILTHGPRGGYGHPAHCEAHRCVIAAARHRSPDRFSRSQDGSSMLSSPGASTIPATC